MRVHVRGAKREKIITDVAVTLGIVTRFGMLSAAIGVLVGMRITRGLARGEPKRSLLYRARIECTVCKLGVVRSRVLARVALRLDMWRRREKERAIRRCDGEEGTQLRHGRAPLVAAVASSLCGPVLQLVLTLRRQQQSVRGLIGSGVRRR